MTVGWKAMFWKTGEQPADKLVCPACKLPSKFTHRTRMHFFHVLGIPLFPVSGKRRLYKCGYCTTEYDAAKVDLQASMQAGTLVTRGPAIVEDEKSQGSTDEPHRRAEATATATAKSLGE